MAEAAIRLRGVSRSFGPLRVLEQLELEVPERRFLALVGPSGCGKTTILNLIAGLLTPSEGRVEARGRAVCLFQQDTLLEWKTVAENAGLGLMFRGAAWRDAVEPWLERAGLARFADYYPSQLSGGMRKRVALVQALIVEPDILLLDEPFSALDVHTRLRMQGELLELWATSRATVVLVTHDLEEAISLADEVAVLSAGPGSGIVARRAVDLARPRDLMELKTQPEFLELYRDIWATLKTEVLRGPSL